MQPVLLIIMGGGVADVAVAAAAHDAAFDGGDNNSVVCLLSITAINNRRISARRFLGPASSHPALNHTMLKLMENARVFTAEGSAASVRVLSVLCPL
jgi:hypothetical protein